MTKRKIKFTQSISFNEFELGAKKWLLQHHHEYQERHLSSKKASRDAETVKSEREQSSQNLSALVRNSIEMGKHILTGLQGVVASENKRAISEDPKYMIISLFTGFDKIVSGIPAFKSVPNPTILELSELFDSNGKSTHQWIKRQLKNHCEKYGTLNEIVIIGHGEPGDMSSRDDKYHINNTGILSSIRDIEKELGKKVVNRVVFAGCSTLANLSRDGVEFYRDFAKEHKLEIVGTTSWQNTASALWGAVSYHAGRYVQFTPEGEIKRDKLDCPYNPLSLLGNDRSWTDFYIGHTREEGAALKKTYEIQQKNIQEADAKRQEWENKCADNGPKI